MVSVKEKIAYGLGDTASNIIFQTVMTIIEKRGSKRNPMVSGSGPM